MGLPAENTSEREGRDCLCAGSASLGVLRLSPVLIMPGIGGGGCGGGWWWCGDENGVLCGWYAVAGFIRVAAAMAGGSRACLSGGSGGSL